VALSDKVKTSCVFDDADLCICIYLLLSQHVAARHTCMIDIRNALYLRFSCNIKFLNSCNNIIVTTARNVHHCEVALTMYVERPPNKCAGPSRMCHGFIT